MAVTTGSGGVGGIFAPSLFMGGIAGFIGASLINTFHLGTVSEKNFSLVGMAGVMAGVMHAPLTAVFLIAEITGGYGLFIPLIITSAFSYLTIMYFEPHSLYTKRLAARGELITHHKDKAVLTLLDLQSVIEKDLRTIKPSATLGEMVKIISQSSRNVFPVMGDDENLMGIVQLDNIREMMFDQTLYNKVIMEDVMVMPPAYILTTDSMAKVMRKFEATSAWNLPVIEESGRYVGFISKAKIFNAYRKILVDFSEE
jgi:CIC family chloride channel protein